VAGFILMLMLPAGRQRPVRTPLDWALLLLAGMTGISLLVTPLPETTQIHALRLTASLAGLYGLVNWANNRTRLLWGAGVLVVGGLALALAAPFVVDWSRATSVPIPSVLYRFFPLLISDPVHPNIIAGLLVVLSPLPLARWLSLGDPKSRRMGLSTLLIPGATFALMTLMLVLTKSRGGYIAGAIGGLLTVWLLGRKKEAVALALVALCLGALLFLLRDWSPDLIAGTTDLNTWQFRQRAWQAALRMMDDFAYTGTGMGTFNYLGRTLYAFWETANPGTHNLYLQVGVDLGYPGLIAYLSTLVLALWMAMKALRALEQERDTEMRGLTVGALAGIVALMSHGVVDMVGWGTRATFVPWLTIGWITAVYCFVGTRPHADGQT
jgi:putative inorganic carbon (HCO3(-)) transporter